MSYFPEDIKEVEEERKRINEERKRIDEERKRIDQNNLILSRMQEETKRKFNKFNEEIAKTESEVKDAAKKAIIEINHIVDQVKNIFDENGLRHIAKEFIRKSIVIKINELHKDYKEELDKKLKFAKVSADKQINHKLKKLDKYFIYVKRYFKDHSKREAREVVESSQEDVKKQKSNGKEKAESEENTKTVTKSVIKESNSI